MSEKILLACGYLTNDDGASKERNQSKLPVHQNNQKKITSLTLSMAMQWH